MNWDPPLHCGRGHELRPGAVKVAWDPCDCPRAVPQPSGHTYMRCLQEVEDDNGVTAECGWQYRENGCERLIDGFPGLANE